MSERDKKKATEEKKQEEAYPVVEDKTPKLSHEDQTALETAMEAVGKIVEAGKEVAEELREAEEHQLVRLKERGRRKSRDLEQQAMAVLGDSLERVFKLIDISGDGQLDAAELQRAFALAGRPTSDEAIQRAIKELDKDNDGQINFEEFKAVAWKTATESTGAPPPTAEPEPIAA